MSVGYGLTDISERVIEKWVRRNFGPIFEPGSEDRMVHAIVSAAVHQRLISTRRRQQRAVDPEPRTPVARKFRLLKTVLGPADRWVSKKVLTANLDYCDVRISGGLVAGLIRTDSKLTGNASLLVFRADRETEPRSWWVGPSWSIDEAVSWLATPAVAEAFSGSGRRVEIDWRKCQFRIVHPDGRTTYEPWRERRGRLMT